MWAQYYQMPDACRLADQSPIVPAASRRAGLVGTTVQYTKYRGIPGERCITEYGQILQEPCRGERGDSDCAPTLVDYFRPSTPQKFTL